MPVVYHCENPACAQTGQAVWMTTDQGGRVLLPPMRWQLVDVEDGTDPVLFCPACGEVWDAHKASKKSRRAVLTVLEGGKGREEPTG